MKRLKNIIIIFLIALPVFLCADYIIPVEDPVYHFLEAVQAFECSKDMTDYYPIYHDNVIEILQLIFNSDISENYKRIARYDLQRLSLEKKDVFESAIYPLPKISRSAFSIFSTKQPTSKLIEFHKNDMSVFMSGIVGIDYDMYQSTNDDKHRMLKYYGLEFGGNITNNIGLYSLLRKGHYTGDPYFSRQDSVQLISDNWENPEKIEIQTECFLKNNIIDVALGYGNIQIGRSITNSVIFTKGISSVPYIKLSKQFGDFSYISLYSQLVPDSLNNGERSRTKSLALQMISYETDRLLVAVGENALYEDRNFDISYSTPLIMYKLVDFANRSRDNVNAFVVVNYIPGNGLMLYNNLFIDDVKIGRLATEEYLSGIAEQFGLSYTLKDIPVNIAFEGTAVGPRTYYHRRQLTYSHRDQLLGFQEGSNLLNLAFRIQYLMPRFECSVLYENMQQGNISNDPFAKIQSNEKFLAGDVHRTQWIHTSIGYNFTSHLRMHLQFAYENKDEKAKKYLYSGIEFSY